MQVYLQHVLHLLQSAMQLSVQQAENEDLFEYNNALRHGGWQRGGWGGGEAEAAGRMAGWAGGISRSGHQTAQHAQRQGLFLLG